MAELKDILYKVSITASYGNMAEEVKGICFDSRQVKPGFVFVAVKGTQSDGHQFISKAVQSGASAIVCEKLPETIHEKIAYATVKNSAQALGIIASNFFGNPSQKLKLVGVTGTDHREHTGLRKLRFLLR